MENMINYSWEARALKYFKFVRRKCFIKKYLSGYGDKKLKILLVLIFLKHDLTNYKTLKFRWSNWSAEKFKLPAWEKKLILEENWKISAARQKFILNIPTSKKIANFVGCSERYVKKIKSDYFGKNLVKFVQSEKSSKLFDKFKLDWKTQIQKSSDVKEIIKRKSIFYKNKNEESKFFSYSYFENNFNDENFELYKLLNSKKRKNFIKNNFMWIRLIDFFRNKIWLMNRNSVWSVSNSKLIHLTTFQSFY